MNRQEFNELLEEVITEITEQKGNFQTICKDSEFPANDARLIAAIALTAVDRYYAKLTRLRFDHPNIF